MKWCSVNNKNITSQAQSCAGTKLCVSLDLISNLHNHKIKTELSKAVVCRDSNHGSRLCDERGTCWPYKCPILPETHPHAYAAWLMLIKETIFLCFYFLLESPAAPILIWGHFIYLQSLSIYITFLFNRYANHYLIKKIYILSAFQTK